MKTLRNAWRVSGKICLALGAIFFALYIILGWAIGFGGGMLAFAINGAVWISIGGIFCFIAQSGDVKHERLKREGFCYDAEIVRIVPNIMIRIGSCVSARAECRYINLEGKTCLVRSGLFLVENMLWTVFSGGPNDNSQGSLTAKVYVNKSDPHDYYVEISDKSISANADHDYR